MTGFSGIFCKSGLVNKGTEQSFKDLKTDDKLELQNLKIFRNTNDKFKDDKLFLNNENSACGIDGCILNKLILVNDYAESWEDVFSKNIKKNFNSWIAGLRGEFNGFYYDKKKESFSLFVNQTGTKPIFYCEIKDQLWFSSNFIDLVLAIKKNIDLSLDITSVKEFLKQGYFNSNSTYFNQIKKLRAGEYIQFDSKLRVSAYKDWNELDYNSNSKTQNIDLFDQFFQQAIELEYRKDLEYDYQHICTLSGGLDSRVNIMYAEKLGFRPKLHLCTSQSKYLDIKIASEIAGDLNEELLFHPLDDAKHLYNIDENIWLNGGLVTYSGSAHMLDMYKNYFPENGGLIHSGQIGDGIFHSFLNNKSDRLAGNLGYKNTELQLLYDKAFNSVNNGHWVTEKFSYLTSPFLNVEVLNFVLSIPQDQRKHSSFYLEWISKYLPDAKKYKWEKINLKPGKFNHKLGLLLNRFRIGLMNKVYSHDLNRSMNPYNYWIQSNQKLIDFIEKSYLENLKILDNIKDLEEITDSIFHTTDLNGKFKVLTFLKTLNLCLKNSNDSSV